MCGAHQGRARSGGRRRRRLGLHGRLRRGSPRRKALIGRRGVCHARGLDGSSRKNQDRGFCGRILPQRASPRWCTPAGEERDCAAGTVPREKRRFGCGGRVAHVPYYASVTRSARYACRQLIRVSHAELTRQSRGRPLCLPSMPARNMTRVYIYIYIYYASVTRSAHYALLLLIASPVFICCCLFLVTRSARYACRQCPRGARCCRA